MINFFKNTLRDIFTFLKIDLTKNLKYDRLTKDIIERALTPDSVCIDIGCHKGEILDLFLKHAPSGKHYAFEPIPEMFAALTKKYGTRCHIFPYALSDKEGITTFHYVKNQPAYSGILKRKYAVENPDIEEIQVDVKMLDTLLPPDLQIDFIKIDVEGGEFAVLKGAKNTLTKNNPLVVFECGMGASDYYGTTPEAIFEYFTALGYSISLLENWLKNRPSLSKDRFCQDFKNNTEYYFIASKIAVV
jgi:FkbM family methyltransferase